MQLPGVVVAAVALAVLGAGCGRGRTGLAAREVEAQESGRRRAGQAAEAGREAGLPEEVATLIGEAAGAAGRSFTVTYGTGDGGRALLVQEPPRRRFDVTLPDGTTRATLVNEAGSFACEQRAERWSCLPSARPPPEVGLFAPTDLERTIGSLSTARASFDLRVERRQVAGVDARCLVTERKASAAADPALGALGVLCIDPSGAVVAIDQPGQSLTAVAYEDGADDAAFILPAPVPTTAGAPRPTG